MDKQVGGNTILIIIIGADHDFYLCAYIWHIVATIDSPRAWFEAIDP